MKVVFTPNLNRQHNLAVCDAWFYASSTEVYSWSGFVMQPSLYGSVCSEMFAAHHLNNILEIYAPNTQIVAATTVLFNTK